MSPRHAPVQFTVPEFSALEEQIRCFKSAGLAPRTVSSYTSDFRVFAGWCRAAKLQPLPADANTVELYVTDLIGRGRKISTARRHVYAIQHAHRQAGLANPCGPGVRKLLAGARRILAQRPAQKQAITLEELHTMVKAIGSRSPIAARNSALLLLGFASALRRSNLAALRVEDLEFGPKGVILWIGHEKQDRVGRGRSIAVPLGKHKGTCPVRALKRWLAMRGISPGPLFCRVMRGHPNGKPILGNRIGQIVQEAVARIGLDPARYGAHSLRAGLATEGLEQGVNEVAIAQQTGHRSLETLRLYLRPQNLFRGNVCGLIGM